jgi:hypothetical protein
MPARLRAFDPAEWGATADADDDWLREARYRQTTAWPDWCRENHVSPLDVLLERRRNRTNTSTSSGDGWVDCRCGERH